MIRSRLVRLNKVIFPVTLCTLVAVIFLLKRRSLAYITHEVLQHASGNQPSFAYQEASKPMTTSQPERITEQLATTAKPITEICKGKNMVGPLYVDKTDQSWDELVKQFPNVNRGGAWSPNDCLPKVKMALIIPYRDRELHLKLFLRQIHPMLQRQRISYQIFVIEQADKSSFNRGKLMNVGYNESLKHADFNCFVFHDVDLIPENDENYYNCHISPAHLSVAVDKFNYKLFYATLFGGVEMFTKAHFEKINGFSNVFWGWGAEDDNLYQRITAHGMRINRPAIIKARYQMAPHKVADKPDDKVYRVMDEAIHHIGEDGLKTLNYRAIKTEAHPLFTHIKADLEQSKDKVIKKIEKVISEKKKQ